MPPPKSKHGQQQHLFMQRAEHASWRHNNVTYTSPAENMYYVFYLLSARVQEYIASYARVHTGGE